MDDLELLLLLLLLLLLFLWFASSGGGRSLRASRSRRRVGPPGLSVPRGLKSSSGGSPLKRNTIGIGHFFGERKTLCS